MAYSIISEGFYVTTDDRRSVVGLVGKLGTPNPVTVSNGKIEIKGFKSDLKEFLDKATFF